MAEPSERQNSATLYRETSALRVLKASSSNPIFTLSSQLAEWAIKEFQAVEPRLRNVRPIL
jgi:hypothetical protein